MALSDEGLHRELRTVFAGEAIDSLLRVETLIERRRGAPADRALVDALFRELHTIKVGAAAAGLSQAARDLHDAEELLEAERDGEAAVAAEIGLDSLRRVVACVRDAVGPVPEGRSGGPVALAELWPPLVRATAEAAALARKFVAFEPHGGELRVDAATAAALRGALLHLVRNAVAHGIEPPAARVAAGKPRVGCITVHAERGDAFLRLRVADDGAGLDFDAIAAAARRRGALAADAVAGAAELSALIFQPAFSTRTSADTLAGRGVGLDAVAHAVSGLGGEVAVESLAGGGCTICLTVPHRLDA